jgi:NADH:ubiquinone oxidoreductase subunit 4 (subunit M)
MLLFLIFILSFTIFFILVGNLFKIQQDLVRSISLVSSTCCFLISIFLWVLFDRSSTHYQFILYDVYLSFLGLIEYEEFFSVLKNTPLQNRFLYFYHFIVSFGVDGISLFFLLLSTFITPLCLLTSYKCNLILVKDYCLCLLFLELFLILTFTSTDLISFFIFFESILIPMFFLIGVWGSRERKIRASFYLFIYTLFGSIFLFFSILVLYYDTGTTNFNILYKCQVCVGKELVLWFFLYLAFSIKIPIIPMHI